MIDPYLTRRKRIWYWWLRYKNAVFYWFTLGMLTGYVIKNWDTCISMQFFSDFNGNNILFLCWILMIFLKIFKIKVRDVEVFTRNLQDEYLQADMQHNIEERMQQFQCNQPTAEVCNQRRDESNDQPAG